MYRKFKKNKCFKRKCFSDTFINKVKFFELENFFLKNYVFMVNKAKQNLEVFRAYFAEESSLATSKSYR